MSCKHKFGRLSGLIFLAIVYSCATLLASTGPDWWYDEQTGIFSPGSHSDDHYDPVNIGQLKHVATQAKVYFDEQLSGGAGPAIDSMVLSFGMGSDPENFALVNIGQLKNISRLFYERLLHEGYITWEMIQNNGVDGWHHPYPWAVQDSGLENNAPISIGQLKLVFSFVISPNYKLSMSSAVDTSP